MPRRNNRPQRRPPSPPARQVRPEESTDEMARRLVDRGLASPLILGPHRYATRPHSSSAERNHR